MDLTFGIHIESADPSTPLPFPLSTPFPLMYRPKYGYGLQVMDSVWQKVSYLDIFYDSKQKTFEPLNLQTPKLPFLLPLLLSTCFPLM